MPAHVLENMTEAVTLADERGVLLYTNSAADRMFGYARDELLGKHVTVLNAYPPGRTSASPRRSWRTSASSGEWIGQWDNIRKDGSRFTTRARITTLVLDGVLHWLCVQDDITDAVAGAPPHGCAGREPARERTAATADHQLAARAGHVHGP
jgi:PAS domain S-box-containing protein